MKASQNWLFCSLLCSSFLHYLGSRSLLLTLAGSGRLWEGSRGRGKEPCLTVPPSLALQLHYREIVMFLGSPSASGCFACCSHGAAWSVEGAEGIHASDTGLSLACVGVLQGPTGFVHVFVLQQAVFNFLESLPCVLVRTLQILS